MQGFGHVLAQSSDLPRRGNLMRTEQVIVVIDESAQADQADRIVAQHK
jgi:hypothetical protein